MKLKRHLWTKDEIKKVIKMWDDKNPDELAHDLKVERVQVMYIASVIRKAGYRLAKKHKKGYIHALIKEAISELK